MIYDAVSIRKLDALIDLSKAGSSLVDPFRKEANGKFLPFSYTYI